MPRSSNGVLLGAQRPRVLHLPDYETTASGQDAVDLATASGLILDPWQSWSLELSCSEVRHPETGRLVWAAFEIGEIVGRQNGKGGILEGRELAGMALFGERILHSSHHFRTTRDAFERLQAIIENSPDLDRMVKKITTANGNEGIEFRKRDGVGGGRIQYIARERGSGRGLPPDVVVNDEAFRYPERAHKALLPAMSARPNPQIWFTTSAPDEDEPDHDALVISRMRARALAAIAGTAKEPRLLWAEFSAAEAAEFLAMLEKATPDQRRAWLGDRERWALSNPAIGYRLTEGFIEGELRGLGARGFAVERLSIGFWPDPDPQEDDDEKPIDLARWEASHDPKSRGLDPVALALDCAPDGSTALAVQGWRKDQRKHAELIRFHPGTTWAVPAILRLIDRHDPAVLVVDASGPAGALVPKLEAAGLEPVVISGAQRAAADQGLVNDLNEDVLRVRSCTALDKAADALRWRLIGDRRAFDRKRGGAHIAPMCALSLAGLGLEMVAANPPKKASTPTPEPIRDEERAAVGDFDLATAGF